MKVARWFLGIDPSASAGGYALMDAAGQLVVGGVSDLPGLHFAMPQIVNPIPQRERIGVCIECPERMFRGSAHVVRNAANLWEDAIRQAFPRRVILIGGGSSAKRVDPSVWRKAVLSNVPDPIPGSVDWKRRALRWCELIGYEAHGNHNLAEAICIAYYCRARLCTM